MWRFKGYSVSQFTDPISHNIITKPPLHNRYPFSVSKSPSSVSTLRRNRIKMTGMSNSLTGFSSELSAVTGSLVRD
ncbi:hypothetical protein HanXRQr2_Chr07g0281551 [Helianthus annuus]|uniref:Uncharacterized protein n=1 Tax=Helianthus annuus TaxID=4232 RepID=A0A9K3II90_HELAN|nr:hypothetical protein HanXRQr2_Chr07g0281551 [Helianthus annuus]